MSKAKKTRKNRPKKGKSRGLAATTEIRDGTAGTALEQVSPSAGTSGSARDRSSIVNDSAHSLQVDNTFDTSGLANDALVPYSAVPADLSVLNSTGYALSNTILTIGQSLSMSILGSVSTANHDQQMMRATTQRTVCAILGDPSPTAPNPATPTPGPDPDCSCRKS